MRNKKSVFLKACFLLSRAGVNYTNNNANTEVFDRAHALMYYTGHKCKLFVTIRAPTHTLNRALANTIIHTPTLTLTNTQTRC